MIHDLRKAREALTPRMSRLELARKMSLSNQYLRQIESGERKFSALRQQQCHAVLEAWKTSPTPTARKRRNDIGKKHRKFRLKEKRKPRVLAEPTPVPHSQDAIVGIG